MQEKRFDIVIDTPIGKRKGVMVMNIADKVITGVLEIFGSSFDFNGKMLDDNNCVIYGTFKTLVSEFYYQANGNISEDCLNLTLNGGSLKYKLVGIQNEVKGDEIVE